MRCVLDDVEEVARQAAVDDLRRGGATAVGVRTDFAKTPLDLCEWSLA